MKPLTLGYSPRFFVDVVDVPVVYIGHCVLLFCLHFLSLAFSPFLLMPISLGRIDPKGRGSKGKKREGGGRDGDKAED